MAKGNIDAPKGSSLLGKPGFTHAGQPGGKKVAPGMSAGRGVGGAEHHKGSSFGGKADHIRGANTKLPGGQNLK